MAHQVTRNGRTFTVYTNRELDNTKGHKRKIEKTGVESGFYEVHCECGWHKGGLINRKSEAIAAHRRHCEDVRDGET